MQLGRASELPDINLWEIIPFLHCISFADSRREFSLSNVPERFFTLLGAYHTFYPTREEWTQDELIDIQNLVADSKIEAIMAFEGDKGVILRYAYFAAVVSDNYKTIARHYMKGRDARFKATKSDVDYGNFLVEEYEGLANCSQILSGRKQQDFYDVMGYLLSHFPLPINEELISSLAGR